MKKTLVAAGLAVVVVALAGFAYGHGRMGHHPDPQKIAKFITWRVNDALDDVKATDAQRKEVLAVKDQLLAQAQGVFGGRQEMHQEMLQQWKADRVDASRIHALIDQRADEMRAFAHQAADQMMKVHDILTPEQRTQLADEIAQHAEGR